MTPRKLSPREKAEALAFKLVVMRRGCEVHTDPAECEPPIQAAHILPKQSLRRRGLRDKVYDPRNGLGACYRAHRRSDAGLERFPASLFSDEFWAFADEVGLRWLAEKLYGSAPAVTSSAPAGAEDAAPGVWTVPESGARKSNDARTSGDAAGSGTPAALGAAVNAGTARNVPAPRSPGSPSFPGEKSGSEAAHLPEGAPPRAVSDPGVRIVNGEARYSAAYLDSVR